MNRPSAFLLLLLLAAPARAEIKASGYLKDLWQYSHSAFEDRPYYLNTTRARLSLEAKAAILRASVDYDHEVLAGSYFRTLEYRRFGLEGPATWLDMEQTLSTGTTNSWRHRLYRGWVGVETEKTLLRFGRQRMAWGTGKLWNPTDVLNAYQPTSLERDERRGVDAAYLRRELGDLSQAELAYAPQDRWPQSAVLARLKTNWKGYDLSAMGGKTAASTGSWIMGGDFAGNLWEGSFHGEWSYTQPSPVRTPYFRGVLGYEYTFPSETRLAPLKDAALVLEYYYNGAGAVDPARYDLAALLGGRETTVGRHEVGLTFSSDLHPLLKLELAVLANAADKSHFFSPSLQWNALDDLYLTGGWQRFSGGRLSEYGRQPNIAFLQAQYYWALK